MPVSRRPPGDPPAGFTKNFVTNDESLRRTRVMSPTRPLPRPTDAEMKILRVLWERGSATVRQVHEALVVTEDLGYTSVLKVMQVMTDKGLVTRDTAVRPQVYRAAEARELTQGSLLEDLAERAFGGSAAILAMRALSLQRATPEELAEVRALLDSLEEDAT